MITQAGKRIAVNTGRFMKDDKNINTASAVKSKAAASSLKPEHIRLKRYSEMRYTADEMRSGRLILFIEKKKPPPWFVKAAVNHRLKG